LVGIIARKRGIRFGCTFGNSVGLFPLSRLARSGDAQQPPISGLNFPGLDSLGVKFSGSWLSGSSILFGLQDVSENGKSNVRAGLVVIKSDARREHKDGSDKMNGISLEKTAFTFLFMTFILILAVGIYIMAHGINRIINGLRTE